MVDDASDDRGLGDLLTAPGVIGAVLGSASGELHAVHGKIDDGEARLAAIAVVARELSAMAGLLGLGTLEVAAVKAPTASRLIARREDAVIAIDVDARRPVGELEAQLRGRRWATPAIAATRAPAVELTRRRSATVSAPVAAACMPPPRPATPPPLPPLPRRGERITRRNVLPTDGDGKALATVPVFAGELGELALPHLLEFLRGGQRTGTLVCTAPQGIGTVHIQRGMVTRASSPRAAVDEPPGDPASTDDVTRARTQIYTAFREMMTWTTGRFAFTAEPSPDAAPLPPLALSAQTILIQLFQEQDEHAL